MLRNKIKSEADIALKAGDSKKVGVLRYLISIIDKKALTMPPDSFSEKNEIDVLQKELKNKQETRDLFLKVNRDDLVSEQDYEIELLKQYLPIPINDSELEKIIDEIMLSETSFGNIMNKAGKIVAGRADGSQIAKIVKIKLS